jgi:hypothetical protein
LNHQEALVLAVLLLDEVNSWTTKHFFI